MVGLVLGGRRVLTIGTTVVKSFEIRYYMPCFALGAAIHAQPVILYIAVLFGGPFSFACADCLYSPVGGKAPSVLLGESPCSPSEPQGAVCAQQCGAGACVRLPVTLIWSAGCWAGCVPYRAVPCGSGGVRVGASVRVPEVRVAWLVLWCQGVPYGASGWARRNTPVFASRSWRARGSRALCPWPTSCSREGDRRK